MATVFPVIVTGTSPVTITSQLSTVTWNEINQSIVSGAYRLKVNTIYLSCQDISQLSSIFYFYRYNQNGTYTVKNNNIFVSPKQYQANGYLDLTSSDIILDNLSKVNFTLNASQTVNMYFYADYVTNMESMKQSINGITYPDFSKKTIKEKPIEEKIVSLIDNKIVIKENDSKTQQVIATSAIAIGIFIILKSIL